MTSYTEKDVTRFWSNVAVEESLEECWEWQKAVRKDGYGRIALFPGRRPYIYKYAHRFAYEVVYGTIPPDLVLDHLCRNKGCVNPTHLEPVTSAENIKRGLHNGGKPLGVLSLTCSSGHTYAPGSFYLRAEGGRECKMCNRASSARYRAKKELEFDRSSSVSA